MLIQKYHLLSLCRIFLLYLSIFKCTVFTFLLTDAYRPRLLINAYSYELTATVIYILGTGSFFQRWFVSTLISFYWFCKYVFTLFPIYILSFVVKNETLLWLIVIDARWKQAHTHTHKHNKFQLHLKLCGRCSVANLITIDEYTEHNGKKNSLLHFRLLVLAVWEVCAVCLCSYASKMNTRVFHIWRGKKYNSIHTRMIFPTSIQLYIRMNFRCIYVQKKADFIETLKKKEATAPAPAVISFGGGEEKTWQS